MIIILIMIFGTMIGNDSVRSILNIAWIIIWVLFIIFLFVHSWMDKKGKFLPKKRDKEG
jgi:Kef-type K+ transport system membrane component KefB